MAPDQRTDPPIHSARYIHDTGAVSETVWNGMLDDHDPPFLRHQFLSLLEDSGCVGPGTGWMTSHLLLQEGRTGEQAVAAIVPLYIKEHSYGEYVFDWAWAHAYRQHGFEYYPKLVCAIPFTPVTSRKLLTRKSPAQLGPSVTIAISRFVDDHDLSSVHALFLEPEDTMVFRNAGYILRQDNQFHWSNSGYQDFEDYLSRFTSKKRKNIRAERRSVRDAGVSYRWLPGTAATEPDWLFMYELYRATISEHGGFPYLTREFFLGLAATMGDRVLLLQGFEGHDPVCGALYFVNRDTLFGRYWGAGRYIPNLHFETCYYQPIEYAIDLGLESFEAGAQGIHKLSRGLAPSTTQSAHWLKHPGFHDAVDRYLAMERHEQERYSRLLRETLPFRQVGPDGAE